MQILKIVMRHEPKFVTFQNEIQFFRISEGGGGIDDKI